MGAAAAIGGIGLGLQAVGMISGSRAQRKAAQANAQASRLQGEYEVANADYDVIVLRQRMAKTLGAQRAGYGASGVSTESGSALDVLADTTSKAVLDQQMRKWQGAAAAQGAGIQAGSYDAQGRAAASGGVLSAAARLASGAANIASSWTPGGTGSSGYAGVDADVY